MARGNAIVKKASQSKKPKSKILRAPRFKYTGNLQRVIVCHLESLGNQIHPETRPRYVRTPE